MISGLTGAKMPSTCTIGSEARILSQSLLPENLFLWNLYTCEQEVFMGGGFIDG